MRKLRINYALNINGSCLLNLPLLETLVLTCDTENSQDIENAIKIMNNLKVFDMVLKSHQINNVILVLQNCSNLKELYLSSS